MTLAHLHTRARKATLRATLVCALTLPAAAVAAEPVAEPVADATEEAGALEAGPEQDPLSGLSGPLSLSPEAGTPAKEKAGKRKPEPSGPFHPVDGEVGYGDVIAAFGDARGRPHEGQDIFAPAGTPVVAPTDAVVVEAGSDGGRGNWISIYDRKRGQSYSYFHMIGPAKPGIGEKVKPGEKLGEVGCSGSCSGDHLHFEVRDGEGPYGAARDPLPMLQKWSRVKG
jgi:murein DD-endopeptidase MepM/ murein hydrolase activator NlpD